MQCEPGEAENTLHREARSNIQSSTMSVIKRAEKAGRRFLNPVPTTVGGPGMIFKILPMMLSSREERDDFLELQRWIGCVAQFQVVHRPSYG